MQRFNLRLTTEEIKTLQTHLEVVLCDCDESLAPQTTGHLRDILTKIIVTQCEMENVPDYHRVQSESDLAF